jgi:hypothetical protein
VQGVFVGRDFLKICHFPSFRGTRPELLFESPCLAPLYFRSLDNPEFAHNIALVFAGVLIQSMPFFCCKASSPCRTYHA